MTHTLLPAFLQTIRTLNDSMPLTKEDLLSEDFLIQKVGN
ncbi:hypothetical protein GCM10009865_07870 [Aeromicrobium ponti]|uniref:Uncharacterized protein n=1 Tax=Cytobacillus oceanisediminis TaxID=665099 RepID=A0A562K730_9BACI|nr:hypothetical protein IQ19_00684 [Cytobacillus oceanisediminis]